MLMLFEVFKRCLFSLKHVFYVLEDLIMWLLVTRLTYR